MFIAPMFATPLPKNFILEPGVWTADEKYDGHRLIVEVANGQTNLFATKGITAWSRYGLERKLPTHLLEAFNDFPNGIYDGELLVPGKRSYGVTELANTEDLVYFMFDVLQIGDADAMPAPYKSRQLVLKNLPFNDKVLLAKSTPVNTWDEVVALRDEVWDRDGEGLILKNLRSIYVSGKRPKNTFIKIKKLQSAILTVVDFVPSRGQIVDRGPYAMVLLRDEDGNETGVKTRNDALCREAEALAGTSPHPWIGRELRIEYQERTPDGSYRHPRWDRWEDE